MRRQGRAAGLPLRNFLTACVYRGVSLGSGRRLWFCGEPGPAAAFGQQSDGPRTPIAAVVASVCPSAASCTEVRTRGGLGLQSQREPQPVPSTPLSCLLPVPFHLSYLILPSVLQGSWLQDRYCIKLYCYLRCNKAVGHEGLWCGCFLAAAQSMEAAAFSCASGLADWSPGQGLCCPWAAHSCHLLSPSQGFHERMVL